MLSALCVYALSCPILWDGTPQIVAHQAPLFMEFPRQENWNGLPFPSPGDLPDPGIVPASLVPLALAGDSLPLHHLGSPQVHSRFSQIQVSININSNIEPIKNLPQINWVYIFALRKLYGTSCKLICIYFVMIPGT